MGLKILSLRSFWIMVSNIFLISNSPGQQPEDTFTDLRDDQSYQTVSIANMVWLASNLNYNLKGSFCYNNDTDQCHNNGRLYEWEVATQACPLGWHLSTEYEWQRLEEELGMDQRELSNQLDRGTKEGDMLKPGGNVGFNAQYGGWGSSEDGKFEALDRVATFWTANESNIDRAWHRDVNVNKSTIYRSAVIKPFALSVRCVKNNVYQTELK